MNNSYPTVNAIAEQWVNIVLTQIEENSKSPTKAIKQSRIIKRRKEVKKKI